MEDVFDVENTSRVGKTRNFYVDCRYRLPPLASLHFLLLGLMLLQVPKIFSYSARGRPVAHHHYRIAPRPPLILQDWLLLSLISASSQFPEISISNIVKFRT